MIPDAAPERLTLPALAPPPPRAPFPFVATAAPVLVSLGIWAVTGSVYSLLFAALGPVVAVGSMLDARRQRRRSAARDAVRAVAALESARHRVRELHERERVRLTQLAPPLHQVCLPSRVAANWARGVLDSEPSDVAPVPVRVGTATRPPVVVIDGGAGALAPEDDLPSAVRTALGEVRRVASELDDAPWLVDTRDGIGIVGPLPAARALTRSIVLQLAATCSPQTTRIASAGTADLDEQWLAALPHVAGPAAEQGAEIAFRLIGQKQQLLVACASERAGLPAEVGVVIDLAPNGHEAARPGTRVEFLGTARATDAANALAALAIERGLRAAQRSLPLAVRLAEVLAASEDVDTGQSAIVQSPIGRGLRAPVGRDATGVIELDLVRDGPHAVVAGTTGAGKSELLVSWVLAMAARHPPTAVTFLLVDFKGGAAFSPLAGLPHVIGTVSDLDARRSARAIESLRAELLRRERVLAERGVRSIDELERQPGRSGGAGLTRLVIVVDEFAAVVSGQPELHELFADLSARGRSLGLHLILCTQRPSGVVRDAVLANVTMRISLRVTDRGDSVAMLGTDAAAMLPPSPRGRALIADGSGTIREVQLALAEPGDAEKLCSVAPRPLDTIWCDPLPELLPLAPLLLEAAAEATSADAAGSGPGIPFGRVDLPAEQRQPIARHDPGADGHLLVLGAARSGRTTVLRTIAAGATTSGVECIVIPEDPAEAWSVLTELLERPALGDPGVVLLDDLDLLLGRVDPDTRHEMTELLTRFARGSRGRSLVVTAQRLSGGVQTLAGLFGGRLLLRQPSREEHVLSGGDGASFDPRLPPGAACWTGGRGGGAAVQVAIGEAALPPARLVVLPVLRPVQEGRPVAVVCPRPGDLARRWAQTGAQTGVRVVVLGDDPVPDEQQLRVSRGAIPVLLLGDPDAWQAEWGLLSLVRREFSFAVIGCGASELRAVTRARDVPPPLGRRDGECWWVEDGSVRRALLASPESS